MKFWNLALTSTLLIFSTYTNAALVERLGGLAYYDTEADLTWLADANYAYTSGYAAPYLTYEDDGRMTWDQANIWVAGLDVAGVTDWRLPDTLQPDLSCSFQTHAGYSNRYNCTGSEMGNMFYNILGGSAYLSITTTHNANYDLFSNIQGAGYWSGTEYEPDTSYAWYFGMYNGHQSILVKSIDGYAWAVHDGDVAAVSAVPIPASVFLFSSGLIGLIGIAKRKKS